MVACEFTGNRKGDRCTRCGFVLPWDCPFTPIMECGTATTKKPVEQKPMLLGDRIEAALTSVGITKERWAAFTGKHGDIPGCGTCEQRQQALNDADQWMRDLASDLGEAAATAISRFWAPISWLQKRKTDQDQPRITPSEPPTIND